MNRSVCSRSCPRRIFLHGAAQVVESKCLEYPAKVLECQLVRFQKCLLAGVRIGPVKRSAAPHAAHAEHIYFLLLAVDFGAGFIPVHLAFLPQW